MLPDLVSNLEDKYIVGIASTSNCSVAIEDNGRVWIWGTLLFDRCRSHKEALKIEQLRFPEDKRCVVIKRAFGAETSMGFLDDTGILWVAGSNGCGQLGVNPCEGDEYVHANLSEPRQHLLCEKEKFTPNWLCKKVKKFAPGGQHGLLLTSDGDVYSSGCVYDGRLGHGKVEGKIKFQYRPLVIERLLQSRSECVLKSNDVVTDVACGYAHSLAINKKGQSGRSSETAKAHEG
eukprot:TRINITY_DN5076_c0_g1_i1.p1 TRINITY_DN5076_c0_g1~~TRINITY_DN5076_c0_g1_i1.p1  ORF type:complete len:233 (+),score=38.50 TRINITY_DN5076_c0_g1_i1:104-802(+)